MTFKDKPITNLNSCLGNQNYVTHDWCVQGPRSGAIGRPSTLADSYLCSESHVELTRNENCQIFLIYFID